jgi:hypothetical protein
MPDSIQLMIITEGALTVVGKFFKTSISIAYCREILLSDNLHYTSLGLFQIITDSAASEIIPVVMIWGQCTLFNCIKGNSRFLTLYFT